MRINGLENEVKNCIRKAAKGGGYILAPFHSHAYVDPTRMKCMIDAAHEFGQYPINVYFFQLHYLI